MKKKQTSPEQAEPRRHSVIRNIGFCIRSTADCCGSLLYWCVILILINAVIPILSAYLPKAVLEAITETHSLRGLVAAVLSILGGIALLSGLSQLFGKLVYRRKYRMNTYYLKKAVLKGLTTDYCNQEQESFRRLQTESFSCCSGNYSPLTGIYDVLVSLCTGCLGLLAFGAILVRVNVLLILFLAATALVGFYLNRRVIRWTAQNAPERIGYEQRLEYINTASGENRAAKDIRMYRMAEWFSELYENHMRGLAGWYRRLTKKVFGVTVWDSGLALLREGITYLYFIVLVWRHRISVADFIFYVGVVTGFSVWLSDLFSQTAQLFQLSQKISSYRTYLEYPEAYRRAEGDPPPADGLPRTIELRNVSYRYEGAEQFTLREIDLTLHPGEHLALVGLNGAGKTTLVKLICGLIDPTEGQVLYDGVDIRTYDRTAFYRQFAAVFQQFSILPVTLAEIVAEAPEESLVEERVRQCLETVGLWEKVSRLPQKMHSRYGKAVYDDGVEFSGGETQKLLLARALYRKAPVLLLDEPTAALDPIAESELYENYHRMSAGKTAVFVSHRLASTSFCSRILLLENGRICEEGTHGSLLEQKGSYSRLFEMQAKYYRETDEQTEVTP